jgi:phosphatidylinositol kinase/protein kinase (PI-3  family)
MIDSVLEVIGTQQHPRIVFMTSNCGKRYKYLLKGFEDLRNDERLMQFFSLVNSIFKSNHETRNHDMYIVRYAVLPLSTNSGLISWMDGVDTFHQMVCDYRKTETIIEQSILGDHLSCDFAKLNILQKYEMFEIVSRECKAEELFRLRWIRAENASVWLKMTERFTISTAVMSMVGYVIGLGDRHPSNLMVQRATGNVVHIDFGESFESTLTRKDFPEKVQFRLTRMIEKGLEASTVKGFFTKIAEIALEVLRMNRWALSALIAIFVSEPLEGREMATDVKQAVKKVSDKMQGLHEDRVIPVSQQVALLIDEARNPMNYCQHYPGWCPFW